METGTSNACSSAAEFETYRPLLFGLSYRMLGSAMDAEDMVQETYLRYRAIPPETVAAPRALLCTIITRLCLNYLESAHYKRETYIGPWLPEPVVVESDPLLQLTERDWFQESLTIAFLILLQQLTPLERAVFLLREVFEYAYSEIAQMLDKEEPACRKIFSRAKKHIAAHRPRFQPDHTEHRRLLEQFLQATSRGDMEGLIGLLGGEVSLVADGGGKAHGAARRPLYGPEVVARFAIASTKHLDEAYRIDIAMVNGEPALVVRSDTSHVAVLFLEAEHGKIQQIRVIGNPDKLHYISPARPLPVR